MSTKEPRKRGDEAAKEWASERAEAFGDAVGFWRRRLDLTMIELSNRTKELGYPITRATIAKIETNQRNAKVDFAEVVVLATALEVSPSDLVFHGFPSRSFRAVPRAEMTSEEAIDWFSEDSSYNPFNGLSKPRVTQSRDKHQYLHDFRRAVEAFESQHQPETGPDKGYYLSNVNYKLGELDGRCLTGWRRGSIETLYSEIRALRESAIRAGAYVELPKWIDTFAVVPF